MYYKVRNKEEWLFLTIVISDSERFVYQPTGDTPIPTQIF